MLYRKPKFRGVQMFLQVVFLLVIGFGLNAAAGTVNIWPTIPFTRGADLCLYKDAYSQTRSEYISRMAGLASQLMWSGASARQAFGLLYDFNQVYEQNLALATRNGYLDVTLESTLKAFISGYYRDLKPREQKISFTQMNDIYSAIRQLPDPNGPVDLPRLSKLNFIAYGTYALAPNCNGDIQVTLHLTGRQGDVKSYLGQGPPGVVMSRIAARIFEDFQRTQFPSQIKVGAKMLTLVGGMNGSVDIAPSPQIAKQACETLNARLPDEFELDILNAYGDWSGGISLNQNYWALPSGKVFAPMLRNPSPVREVWEVNASEFSYYCVQD